MIQDIEKKFKNEYCCKQPELNDSVFVFAGDRKRTHRLLVSNAEGEKRLPSVDELKALALPEEQDAYRFLFRIGEENYYLLWKYQINEIELQDFHYEGIRSMMNILPKELAFASMTAYHLYTWYLENVFCGSCGTKMEVFQKERAMHCPACNHLAYPKIAPAVIVGVKNGNKILTSQYAGRDYKGIALLAGFCEIGEIPEETVKREVMEEVGLKVKNIHYYASQPWGMDCNLLLGFYCDVDGSSEVTIDRSELAKAVWVEREDLEEADNGSLTGSMINRFRDGLEL